MSGDTGSVSEVLRSTQNAEKAGDAGRPSSSPRPSVRRREGPCNVARPDRVRWPTVLQTDPRSGIVDCRLLTSPELFLRPSVCPANRKLCLKSILSPESFSAGVAWSPLCLLGGWGLHADPRGCRRRVFSPGLKGATADRAGVKPRAPSRSSCHP